MVMQNRHDGSNSHDWWEDLPPGLRRRFGSYPQPPLEPDPARVHPAAGDPTGHRPGVIADLSRVAGLFLAVAAANLLFLLLALAFLFGGQPAH
jgi:hypothetical protein